MIQLQLEGNVVPKARPRCSGRRAYLPARYRLWKQAAIAQLRSQYQGEAIARASVAIELYGSLRGDLDNLCGAILDAMVQANVLKDDRISCVPELRISHTPGKQKRAVVVLEAA